MQSALIYHPVLPFHARKKSATTTSLSSSEQASIHRSPESALEEAVGLALAIQLNIVSSEVVTINKPRPATLFGTGKLKEMKQVIDDYDERPELVIIDGSLSPVQHRNLENALNIKVLDRTALILEIFGERARTAEGRLQVELAHLTYQRSRLVRSWTHLERQRGGAGFLGGPGERQIESDRRVLAEKIVRLQKKLEEVKRTRTLQREKRKRAPQPVIALVGYTNAGKSTLFNSLTKASVQAQDLLFATLDPTMRMVSLPSGQEVIFSDTVGFISDLPTQLVAAFRATLEEVLEADVIIHVRDISHPDTNAQRHDVLAVLADLGVDTGLEDRIDINSTPVVEALNKIDLLNPEDQQAIKESSRLTHDIAEATADDPVRSSISAVTGEGLNELFDLVDEFLTADRELYVCTFPLKDGAARAYLHAHGDILSEDVEGEQIAIRVRLSEKSRGQFETQFTISAVPEVAVVDKKKGRTTA